MSSLRRLVAYSYREFRVLIDQLSDTALSASRRITAQCSYFCELKALWDKAVIFLGTGSQLLKDHSSPERPLTVFMQRACAIVC
jgi:hypothetical protein